MNKELEKEILKREYILLENLMKSFHSNTYQPSYANQSKSFSSSMSYRKSLGASSRSTVTANNQYRSLNIRHQHLQHKVLPNTLKPNKFTFIANKAETSVANKNQTKNNLFSGSSKYIATERKANIFKPTVSSTAMTINPALSLLSKAHSVTNRNIMIGTSVQNTSMLHKSNVNSNSCSNLIPSSIQVSKSSNCTDINSSQNSSKTSAQIKKDDSSVKFSNGIGSLNTVNPISSVLQNNNQTNGHFNTNMSGISVNNLEPMKINIDSKTKSNAKHTVFKFINKNSQSQLAQNLSSVKQNALIQQNSNGETTQNKTFMSRIENYNTTLKKDLPTKQVILSTNVKESKSRFKLINRNVNSSKKPKNTVKYSSDQNLQLKKDSLVPKTKKLIVNRYSIKNMSKGTIVNNLKYKTAFNQSKNIYSKYKIVNENLHTKNSSQEAKQDNAANEKNNLARKPNIVDNSKCYNDVDTTKPMKDFLNWKINGLKYKCPSNEEFDILTDFSPDELVAMDTQSLLKLSALLKSSDKRQPLVKKSKYKLVSKQPSLLNKAAKMVKTKYKVKSSKVWGKQRTYTSTLYKSNCAKYKSPWLQRRLDQHLYSVQNKRLLKLKNARYKKTNVATINNYRASKMKLTRVPRKSLSLQYGKRFSAHSLNSESTPTKPQLQNLASRVLHRSIQTACISAAKKKEMKKNNTYCMFFNRFGKCNRGTSCPYIHDPSKIAVCTRFLRGTCKVENCPFSHEKSPGKMAICSYFLQGLCTKEDCPYRHEQLNPDTQLCKMFVQGYCSLGTKCQKAHVLICPDHFKGECKNGNLCAYPHPPKKEKKVCSSQQKIEENTKETNEETLNLQAIMDTNETEDEDFRYFNTEISTSEDEPKMKNVEVSNSKSISCVPRRTKTVDCPLFIPL